MHQISCETFSEKKNSCETKSMISGVNGYVSIIYHNVDPSIMLFVPQAIN